MRNVQADVDVIGLDESSQRVQFAEPLYWAYYNKRKAIEMGYFAAQDLAKFLVSAFQPSAAT